MGSVHGWLMNASLGLWLGFSGPEGCAAVSLQVTTEAFALDEKLRRNLGSWRLERAQTVRECTQATHGNPKSLAAQASLCLAVTQPRCLLCIALYH